MTSQVSRSPTLVMYVEWVEPLSLHQIMWISFLHFLLLIVHCTHAEKQNIA